MSDERKCEVKLSSYTIYFKMGKMVSGKKIKVSYNREIDSSSFQKARQAYLQKKEGEQ